MSRSSRGYEEVDRDKLRSMLDGMFWAVIERYVTAFDCLSSWDAGLAQRVVESDDAIDVLELRIEEECLRQLAMVHPVREDLRFVFTVLKAITDLERIGDESTNLAKLVLKGGEPVRGEEWGLLSSIFEETSSMLRDCRRAFDGEVDPREVFARDRRVDEAYSSLLFGRKGVDFRLLLAARHMERVGDHVANIAERAYYMLTGRRIKEELPWG